jgi:glutathione S-transferase
MNDISMTSFRSVPPFAEGLVRDLRVLWAAHEAGLQYSVEQLSFDERHSAMHLARHPFGQVPTAHVGDLNLFESAAIIYALGLKHPQLLPTSEAKRLETLSWMFAALNTVEPPILTLFSLDVLNPHASRDPAFREVTLTSIQNRLSQLAGVLEGREYLMQTFTIADIIMATTLRFLRHTDVVSRVEPVADYLARCEARPAFRSALARQQAQYDQNTEKAA